MQTQNINKLYFILFVLANSLERFEYDSNRVKIYRN